jgi:hypothetical protein
MLDDRLDNWNNQISEKMMSQHSEEWNMKFFIFLSKDSFSTHGSTLLRRSSKQVAQHSKVTLIQIITWRNCQKNSLNGKHLKEETEVQEVYDQVSTHSHFTSNRFPSQ